MHLNDPPCLSARGLSFSYNQSPVLENLHFDIHPGEYVGLIGPNGSGKTTLLKILLGLLKPDSGTVTVLGHAPTAARARGAIGYVAQKTAQESALFPATVEEIVRLGRVPRLGLLRFPGAADRAAAENALRVTGADAWRHRLLGTLSGGQRQRVMIARALAGEPKILILDEPMVGVDPAAQNTFYSFLRDLHRNLGITILFVSHDIHAISREVETVLCLNRTLICHESPADILKAGHLERLYGAQMKPITHHDHA